MKLSDKQVLANSNVVVFGGTGSLGKRLVKRILSADCGMPSKIVIVSRDEAKQYQMRLEFERLTSATDDVMYRDRMRNLQFYIADIRDYAAVRAVLRDADFVFSTAALKQVPSCEYFPYEAVMTNVIGTENVIRAIREDRLAVKTMCGISTDKACKPVNVMGMTKALQERLLARANLDGIDTRFICVRYGNVLASRGSVVPLFIDQIGKGGPVTLTTRTMTRFLLSLDQAVDTIFAAVAGAGRGEIYVPIIPAAKIVDLADVLIDGREIEKQFIGIRPGEKEHEIMISEEESYRTVRRDDYYAILPMLPELQPVGYISAFPYGGEYSSSQNTMTKEAIFQILQENALLAPPNYIEKRQNRVSLI